MASGIVSKTVLNPLLTGPLFLVLAGRAPAQISEPILRLIQERLSSETLKRAVTALKWLSILGLGNWVHNSLSALANNNFYIRSDKSRYDWPYEVVVITGAASGFGRLMSKDLASRGVNVVALDLVDSLPADMQGDPKITYYKCDVTSRDAVMTVAEQIRKAHGDPSVLINNAGVVGTEMDVLSVTPQQVNKIYQVNVISHYNTLQAFMPAMVRANKGHIVTIASLAAYISPPAMSPYSSSKAAVLALHETLKSEAHAVYKAPGIKFTVVQPTWADTNLITKYRQDFKKQMLVLEPKVVADSVVKQVLSCRGGHLIVPPFYAPVSLLRALPAWLAQTILRFTIESSGISRTARKFSGQAKNV